MNKKHIERKGVGIAIDLFESIEFAFREQKESDYGIDAHAELIISDKPTGQLLGIQLKSGPSYFKEIEKNDFIFRTNSDHFEYWKKHVLPVIICLCDINKRIIYWQAVTSETTSSTGKGYKIKVPNHQMIEKTNIIKLTELLTPIVSADRYTIFRTDDTSLGVSERYSFKAVINGNATKAEIAISFVR